MRYDSIESFQATLERRIAYIQHQWRLAVRIPLKHAVNGCLLTEDRAIRIMKEAKGGFDATISDSGNALEVPG